MLIRRGGATSVLSTLLLLAAGSPVGAADDPVTDTVAPVISNVGIPAGAMVGLNPYLGLTVSDNVGVVRVEVMHGPVRVGDSGTGAWETPVSTSPST
jgi:hypothetical protein